MPERFVAEALVEALADVPVSRALVARASQARDVLPDALRARGAEVDVLALYETVAEPLSEHALAQARRPTTSRSRPPRPCASSSRRPARRPRCGGRARRPFSPHTRIVSIGPVTSETLREHGLPADVEAERHDIDGLLQALLADAAARDR